MYENNKTIYPKLPIILTSGSCLFDKIRLKSIIVRANWRFELGITASLSNRWKFVLLVYRIYCTISIFARDRIYLRKCVIHSSCTCFIFLWSLYKWRSVFLRSVKKKCWPLSSDRRRCGCVIYFVFI